MDVKRISRAWIVQSKDDWEVVQSLFEKKHYPHALFFCHLALEKFIKAIIVRRTKHHSPYSHDLLLLAQEAGLDADARKRRQLAEINTFNIRARYDDVKRAFSRKAKRAYAEKYVEISNDLIKWLKKEFRKK